MTALNNESRPGRRIGGRVAQILFVSAVSFGTVLNPLPAAADPAVAPVSGSYTISGAGYGHGWGMSQYGAYGAARKGLTWRQIMTFYYPKTKQVQQPVGTSIKVWITADRDNDLKVMPAPGLRLKDGSGHSYVLPRGANYRAWRVTRSGSGFALSHRTVSGAWAKRSTPLRSGSWWFSNTAKVVTVWVPGGALREYRGSVALVKRTTSGARTVNRVGMEDYVRGVVQSEMPTSWHAQAVAAQTVAARSYGARLKYVGRSTGYDACDTTTCQVYRGVAVTSTSGRRTLNETGRGNAAVKATSRTILTYRGVVALTQFSSSNGGAMARGDHPYLVAKRDPYDSVVTSNRWSRKVSAATLARLWPSAGKVREVRVTTRDGSGRWGGRVNSVTLVGSRRNVVVPGGTFAYRLGLRSRLFTLQTS